MVKKHLKETAILRRFAIIEVLRHEGTMHIGDLAQKFQVSKQTIHKDIDILTVCFNIQVKRGRYHSGYPERSTGDMSLHTSRTSDRG